MFALASAACGGSDGADTEPGAQAAGGPAGGTGGNAGKSGGNAAGSAGKAAGGAGGAGGASNAGAAGAAGKGAGAAGGGSGGVAGAGGATAGSGGSKAGASGAGAGGGAGAGAGGGAGGVAGAGAGGGGAGAGAGAGGGEAGAAGAGGAACGALTEDMGCNTCTNANCCAEATACTQDAGCAACLGASPPASCAQNALLGALSACVDKACATECGLNCTPEGCCAAPQVKCNGQCVDPSALAADDQNCGACGVACTDGAHCYQGSCQHSKIEHVVLVVQENHTFESYFGEYCQAKAGSNPSCTGGRSCCEGAPVVNGLYTEPHGATALLLDDDPSNGASNFAADRDHDRECEVQQVNGGAMDQFVTGATGAATCFGVGPKCSSPLNFSLASGQKSSDPVFYYWSLADGNALADRYFQPVVGGTASNDMYIAGARFVFADNEALPDVLVGTSQKGLCAVPSPCASSMKARYDKKTIADLLLDGKKTFTAYADGFDQAYASAASGQGCPKASDAPECPYNSCFQHPVACNTCLYNPADVPFLYYQGFADQQSPGGVTPTPHVKDYNSFAADVKAGTLPNFAYVKARLFRNEHPNVSTIKDGVNFVQNMIDIVQGSAYKGNTLILVTWDEGGGFYDHVSPPPAPPVSVDADENGGPVHYGTRVPMIAIGPLARSGQVSHVAMEHSSVVKFLEYNFLGPVGQLGARDGWVNNIGSLLDPAKTGIPIPEK
jgi:phospholipase C